MFESRARMLELDIAPGRRTLAVSDIHANLPYFRALLDRCGFCDGDELIIVGDFLEKGEKSLETLRFIMELSRRGNVHALCGNCDTWYEIFDMGEKGDAMSLEYVRARRRGLLWDMLCECGIDPFALNRLGDVKELLRERFRGEWSFLSSLPHVITAGSFIFAHAGVDPSKPLSGHSAEELMRCDAFMTLGRRFEKWVVVGHWPVMLYGENIVSAAPVIDREAHIVSIDGGCVLKDDGQLNALVIPDISREEFSFVAYDAFPLARVLRDQEGSGRSYYIRWGDSTVEVLERGGEFSRCRHVRTGYEMDILTKYLFTDERVTGCNDCTDYVLPLRAGDVVSVVERTGRGCLVKHNSVSGWYFGELEDVPTDRFLSFPHTRSVRSQDFGVSLTH